VSRRRPGGRRISPTLAAARPRSSAFGSVVGELRSVFVAEAAQQRLEAFACPFGDPVCDLVVGSRVDWGRGGLEVGSRSVPWVVVVRSFIVARDVAGRLRSAFRFVGGM
jgi:hypothetical protein